MSPNIQPILEKAYRRERLTKAELRTLVYCPEYSYESAQIRAMSDRIIREKTGNAGVIIAQIGVDIHPCDANCKFCSFGRDHTCVPSFQVSRETVRETIESFTRYDDLFGLYLMTMADTDKEYLLDTVRYARSIAPLTTQIWINTGDNDLQFYKDIKAAGASGAYHVHRIGEGVNTSLDPATRVQSMRFIRQAGLDLFSCCEPIGPETTLDEITEEIYRCVELGVTQFGAMKRTAVPGTPFEAMGQISDLKMAHMMGCVGLAYASVETAKIFGVHEPCEAGYLSGANFITAETGANPRDTALDTSKARGWDMARCRKLMFECGFTSLLKGDGSSVRLNYDYLKKTDSDF